MLILRSCAEICQKKERKTGKEKRQKVSSVPGHDSGTPSLHLNIPKWREHLRK